MAPRLKSHTYLALLVCACGRDEGTRRAPSTDANRAPASEAPSAGTGWQVSLVDSVGYANEMGTGYLRRVRVASPGVVDTLPGVLVLDPPVPVGDSVVYGIRYEEDQAVGLFAYDRRSRRTRLIPPPAGWTEYSEPALAPDGGHVAFLGKDEQDHGYGAVADVLGLHVVYRGPSVTMLETDAGVDRISWSDAEHFEIRIALTYATGGEQRIRGSLSPPRATIDTVRPDSTHMNATPAA